MTRLESSGVRNQAYAIANQFTNRDGLECATRNFRRAGAALCLIHLPQARSHIARRDVGNGSGRIHVLKEDDPCGIRRGADGFEPQFDVPIASRSRSRCALVHVKYGGGSVSLACTRPSPAPSAIKVREPAAPSTSPSEPSARQASDRCVTPASGHDSAACHPSTSGKT